MRALLIGGGLAVVVVGCFAPFSWPDDRPEEVPPPPPTAEAPPADPLAEAADRLDRGDEAGAVPHLRAYVSAHPDAVMIRAHLAELLLRRGRPTEARAEFERFVADAQRLTGPANAHLVHVHTRLMEIAADGDDAYAEHLHRGIGLILLVKRWDADPARRDPVTAEQTLSKAAAALRAARAERPGDTRANLYLAEAYDRLGQPSAARAARQAARAGLPDPAVTPAERERIDADLASTIRP